LSGFEQLVTNGSNKHLKNGSDFQINSILTWILDIQAAIFDKAKSASLESLLEVKISNPTP
jgi:hypothetical protein